MLKVGQDAIADVVDEGKVGPIAGLGRALEGNIDPVGIVAGHLVAANLENW